MTRWEQVEDWIIRNRLTSFNNATLAADFGVSGYEASLLIQDFLMAQRSVASRTTVALRREGRTRSAVWHVGARQDDVKVTTQQAFDDIVVRFTGALAPDLRRMGDVNPRVRQLAEAIIQSFEANLNVMAASLP